MISRAACRQSAISTCWMMRRSSIITAASRFRASPTELIAEHLKILDRKHPDYSSRVQRFIAANPLRDGPSADRAMRCCGDGTKTPEYTVLHLLHNKPLTKKSANLPGGVEYHVADLVRMIPEAAHWSLYVADREYHLTAHVPESERTYRVSIKALDLSTLIRPELFDVVHVHHTLGFDFPSSRPLPVAARTVTLYRCTTIRCVVR